MVQGDAMDAVGSSWQVRKTKFGESTGFMAHSNGVCLVWGETVTSCLKPSSCINNAEKWPRPEPLRVLASPSKMAKSANKNKSYDCQRLEEKRLVRKGHRQGLGQPTTHCLGLVVT